LSKTASVKYVKSTATINAAIVKKYIPLNHESVTDKNALFGLRPIFVRRICMRRVGKMVTNRAVIMYF
jgi:hypothetical protein